MFANLITRRTDCENTVIARSGFCSIYNILKSVRPAVVRDATRGPRDGISEVEFNKSLQAKR